MRKWFLISIFAAFMTLPLQAQYKISVRESLLAVITHKGGFASGLAHNHFIQASEFSGSVQFDKKRPNQLRFQATVQTKDLLADPPAAKEASAKMIKLGVLSEPFSEPSSSDRGKIRTAMLGSDQLNANKYSTISGKIISVYNAKKSWLGFDKAMKVALTVRDKTVSKNVWGKISAKGSKLEMTLLGVFKFSDFGITPYSAGFGAVKNQDEFHLYIELHASQ